MISSSHLLGYALASLILIVIPGPSVLFVVGRALSYGRRTALATVCGNSAGNYVVAACVAFGIGTLVERSTRFVLLLHLPSGHGAEAVAAQMTEVMATLPAQLRLTEEDVEAIRAIGDNTGCMALKGANPEHSGEERPDRWDLDEHLAEVAERWGIAPDRDLTKLAAHA